jgi:hypothetical protein
MNITDEQFKELKQLLWILDSKHNVSVPQTQENINYIADEIIKLFSIPVVVKSFICDAEEKGGSRCETQCLGCDGLQRMDEAN